MSVGKKVCKFLVEGASLLTLVLLCLALWLSENRGVSYKRGFFCDDDSIRLPYKPSTVPTFALMIISCSLPVIIILCEIITEIKSYFRVRSNSSSYRKGYLAMMRSPWFIRMLNLLKWYLCGILITLIVTSSGKMAVGRLRPHFIDVCKPNFTLLACTDASGFPIYVNDYQCFGDQKLLLDARLSWPSGHSSISAYVCVFLVAYLCCCKIVPVGSILKALLTLVSLMIAVLTGLSRVSDNKHHPTDVLCGWLLGIVVAIAIVVYNLTLFGFKRKHEPDILNGNSHCQATRVVTSEEVGCEDTSNNNY